MQSDMAADARRIDEVIALARRVAGLQARMCALVAACDPGEDDGLREELSCALRISLRAADDLLVTGRELASRLPATRTALATGEISYEQAKVIATGLLDVADDLTREIEVTAVQAAGERTPGKLRRWIEKAVITAGPDAAQRAADSAVKTRDVILFPQPHGMATVMATMPAAAAHEVMLALDAAADRKQPGDTRSRGERRADALHGWARHALTTGELPTRHGRTVTVHVTMSAATALGLSTEPAELTGYGPVPAGTAQALAADATWQTLVTDAASGEILHLGRTRYRPGQALRDLLLARYTTCTFPHCTRPATACDLDHRDAYDTGGTTDPGNVAPLCRRHHRLKTHHGWTPTRNTDGSITWTSPHNRQYTTHPENRHPEPEENELPATGTGPP